MNSMDLNDLKAYKKNPRKITSEDFKLLGDSLKEFGDLSGVVLNQRTGELVGGNQRTNFFKGDPEAVKIEVTEEFTPPTDTGTVALGYVVYKGEKYSFRKVDWDEAKEARANILANKVGGTWDFDMLANAFDQEMLLESGWKSFELGFSSRGDDEGNREQDQSELPDSMKSYLDGNIRQLSLFFSVEEFEEVLPKLDKIMAEHELASHTDVFNFLLKHYEDNTSK